MPDIQNEGRYGVWWGLSSQLCPRMVERGQSFLGSRLRACPVHESSHPRNLLLSPHGLRFQCANLRGLKHSIGGSEWNYAKPVFCFWSGFCSKILKVCLRCSLCQNPLPLKVERAYGSCVQCFPADGLLGCFHR